MGILNQLDDKLLFISRSATVDSGDLAAAGKLIVHNIAAGLKLPRVSIWFFNSHGTALTLKIGLHNDEIEHHSEFELTQTEYPAYFKALQTERIIIADNAHTHSATCEFSASYLTPNGINSMLDAPIRHRGNMVGIICAEHVGPGRQWQPDEVRFVAAHADLYGRALSAYERNIYERQLIEQNEKLEQQVTERTAKLLETEKMAALGKLVAGVAHEVNTPLGIAITAVSHNEELRSRLQKSFEQQALTQRQLQNYLSESEESLNLLANNLERASRLVQTFKRTAVDQSHYEISEFNLRLYLQTVVTSLRPLLKYIQPNIIIDCSTNLWLNNYPGAFAQIFTNLITNSCEHGFKSAAPHNSQKHEISPRIDIHCEHEQDILYCTYKDNGKGMPEEYLAQACEPFFTLNRQGEGSGLGLSIVYNLVCQQLGGELKLSSPPGQGLTVSMQMPLNYKRQSKTATAQASR